MEITQHAKYTCTFCGKVTVRRQATGIWDCKSCKRTVAGGAYTVSCVPSHTIQSIGPRWKTNICLAPPLLLPCDRPCDDFVRLLRFKELALARKETALLFGLVYGGDMDFVPTLRVDELERRHPIFGHRDRSISNEKRIAWFRTLEHTTGNLSWTQFVTS